MGVASSGFTLLKVGNYAFTSCGTRKYLMRQCEETEKIPHNNCHACMAVF